MYCDLGQIAIKTMLKLPNNSTERRLYTTVDNALYRSGHWTWT